MREDLVIFDCDGVLVDSELIACQVSAACLAEIGLSITVDEILARYVGVSTTTMLADLEARFRVRIPADFVKREHLYLREAFDAELVAMPRIEAALSAITSSVCVASSSVPDRLRHALSLVGLLHHFEPHIFSATQVEHGKPAPDLFLFAARQMGVEPHKCLVIEDSAAGVAAAVAAGMRAIGFTGGSHCRPSHADHLRQLGALEIITDFSELARFL